MRLCFICSACCRRNIIFAIKYPQASLQIGVSPSYKNGVYIFRHCHRESSRSPPLLPPHSSLFLVVKIKGAGKAEMEEEAQLHTASSRRLPPFVRKVCGNQHECTTGCHFFLLLSFARHQSIRFLSSRITCK